MTPVKVRMMPAMMPGSDKGSVTRHSVRHAPAPSACEASVRLGSILPSTVRIGSTISGMKTCVSTITTPVSVNRRLSGSWTMPSPSAIWLMMPCRPRMTIHAKVRTTTLVKIGRMTMKTSALCQRGELFEAIQASGKPTARQRAVVLTPSPMVSIRIE